MARVAAAVAALAALAGASSSAPTTTGGRIVFASDRASTSVHAALYTIGVDGRYRRRLLANADGILEAAWSPGGRWIAFFRSGGIFVVPAGGGKPRLVGPLTDRESDTTFAWSPDGTRIAYLDTDAASTLTVVGVGRAHAAPVRLTRTAGIDKPAWSPDGRRIAFIREHGYRFLELATVDVADRRVRVLVPRAQGSDPAWSPDGRTIAYDRGTFEIVLVDVATGARRLLGDWGNTTSWSPDGKKLAAIRFDDVNVLDVRTGRRVRVSRHFYSNLRPADAPLSWSPDSRRLAVPVYDDVYLVRADGHGRRRVTRYGRTFTLGTVPSLAPNGRRVAYVAERNVPFDDDLYSIRPDGSGLRTLTRDAFWDADPAWSPDRSRIAYVRETGPLGQIVVMRAAGGGARVVASGLHPAWAADGHRLAYDRDGDLYVLDLDGGREQLLVGGATLDSDPAWSPDGRRIAFARRARADSPADVWIAAADGSGAAQLTRIGDASDHCHLKEAYSPVWSPDGTEIAYVRGDSVDSPCYLILGSETIRAIREDGTGDRFVTAGGEPVPGASDPAWSPDGTRIALTVTEQLDVRDDPTFRVGIVDRNGRGLRLLVARPNAREPDWR